MDFAHEIDGGRRYERLQLGYWKERFVYMSAPGMIALIIIFVGLALLSRVLGLSTIGFGELARTYWPLLLLTWGLGAILARIQMARMGRIVRVKFLVFPLTLAGLGVLLLANNLGWVHLQIQGFWRIVWPLLLVYFGLSLLPFGRRAALVSGGVDGTASRDSNRLRLRMADSNEVVTTMLGDLHFGATAFELASTRYDILAGAVKLDLSRALIPDAEITLDIAGGIGDVEILVPSDLPIALYANVSLGDIDFLGEKSGGLRRHVSYRTVGYSSAQRRVRIFIELKAGGVAVRNV